MSIVPAIAASGPRELKRARPIPVKVRRAVLLMIYGKPDDENCAPLSFIEAATLAGIAPDHMRRYLDRADVRALLRSERRVFREAICAGNEGALQRVRDKSNNSMAQVAAVRVLEQMVLDAKGINRMSEPQTPGLTIQIVNQVAPTPAHASMTIDVAPAPDGTEHADR